MKAIPCARSRGYMALFGRNCKEGLCDKLGTWPATDCALVSFG